MKNSFQIKLNKYFFTKVFVAANPAFNPKGNILGSQVISHLTVGKTEDDSPTFYGELKLSVSLDKGENPPYEIDMNIFGSVDVIGDVNEDEKVKAAQTVLMQVLYGASREMVHTLTSRGPWIEGFLLPLQVMPPPETNKPATAPKKPAAASKKIVKEPRKKAKAG